MKRYLVILGTRPEAIKLAPLIREAKKSSNIELKVCSTGQHKAMLAQAQKSFEFSVDYDLGLMTANQSLSKLHVESVIGIHNIIKSDNFDGVIVQGDTTSGFAGALAAFHEKLPIIHVEAGLRTWNIKNPFPEEGNRALIDSLATICAAPTELAAENLRRAGVPESNIHVTGNTAIDSLIFMNSKLDADTNSDSLIYGTTTIDPSDRIITITGHRRESFGEDFEQICAAVRALSARHPNIQFVYPVHLNPNVQEPVHRILGGIENVHLIEPISYAQFVQLLSKSFLVLTDSGGIQEEAPSLDLPVLVMRKNTERPEGIAAGCAKLVGVSTESIVTGVEELLNDPEAYELMANAANPYGDGQAARNILQLLD